MTKPLEKKLLTIPGFSPLMFEDEKLLRSSFNTDSVQYMQSFLYLLRSSHGENGSIGYKFISQEVKAVIGMRNDIIYITPVMDSTHGKKLQELCEEIFKKTGSRILLKKFSQKLYSKFTALKETKSTDNVFEDDTCPETILNLTKLFITPEGKVNRKAKRFFRKVKRFKKLDIHLTFVKDLSQIPSNDVKKFLKIDEKKYSSFLPVITYLYTFPQNTSYQITTFLYKNLVQALYIVEKFSETEVGLYCGITAKNKPGITEWMDHTVFQQMFFDGIETVYLGGSENQGINYFVTKLLPEKPKYFVETVEYKFH